VPRVGDTERMPRVSYPAGAEIVVRYADESGGSRRGSTRGQPASPPADSRNSPASSEPPAVQPVIKTYKNERPVERRVSDDTTAQAKRVRRRTPPTKSQTKLQKLSALARTKNVMEAAVVDLTSKSVKSCEENLGLEESDKE